MHQPVTSPPTTGRAANPPAVSFEGTWPWALFALAMLLLSYFVGIDEGATMVVPGNSLHEWVHDGRHLLGFPCH